MPSANFREVLFRLLQYQFSVAVIAHKMNPKNLIVLKVFLLTYTQEGSFQGRRSLIIILLKLESLKRQKPRSYPTPNV